MNRASLIAVIEKYREPLRANGVTGLFIYGSRARGDNRPDSDLDLFIDYEAGTHVPSLFRLIEIEKKLAGELGVPVSITTRNSLHPLMRERIESDAARIL